MTEIQKTYPDCVFSHVYLTRSLYDPGQPDYANLALALESDQSPQDLLWHFHTIEKSCGRPFPRIKSREARTLDIDIILMGDLVMVTPELTIPHASYKERAFVLLPLLEIDPDLCDPLSGQKIVEISSSLPDQGVYLMGPLF